MTTSNVQRRTGEQKCDRRLLQMIPAELDRRGKERVKPWEITKIFPGVGVVKVEASAIEEIRLDDVLTLIGATGVVQDAISKGTATISEMKEAGGKTLSIVSAVLPSSVFCRQSAGDHDVQAFVLSLERLQSYRCKYTTADGSCGSASYLYEYKYDAPSGEISVIMKKSVLDYFSRVGWIVDIAAIRKKLKSSASKALALYLSQQPGDRFNVDTLISRVNLKCTEHKENRRMLRAALDELCTNDFIVAYKMDKDFVNIHRKSQQESIND